MLDSATDNRGNDTLLTLVDVGVRINDTDILTGISLPVRQGASILLLGPNGSGKTTLLRTMMGLVSPTSGTITRMHRARLAFVFQKPVMLKRSVAANVAFALAAAGFETEHGTIERLLDQVGLSQFANRPARQLSGGEQQRLALARALARRPDLLLLDEPTASLDPAQTKAVEDIIERATEAGVTVVMSSHDIGQARRLAGEVVMLLGGRLVERTAADTFFKQPASVEARRFLAGDLVL